MSSSKRETKTPARAAVPPFLRSRVRSTAEVRAHLLRRGDSPRQVAVQLTQYRVLGLLDDRAAARLWADHWARQGYAAAAIRLKLAQKGFPDALIGSILNQDYPPADDEARASAWLARRARSRAAHPARSRLARALASRGFDAELIERLLGESSDYDQR